MSKSLCQHRAALLVVLFGLLLAGPLGAQTDDPCAQLPALSYGETLTGSITDALPVFFACFDGNMGDEIVIEMRTTDGNLDPLLILADPLFEGEDDVYAENDDLAFGIRDARIEFTLPETTQYMIVATRFELDDGVTTGSFTLSLTGPADAVTEPDTTEADPDSDVQAASPLLVDAVCTAQTLGYGDEFAAAINDARYGYPLCFDGAAGDVITVTMTAVDGDLDPYLLLLPADFTPDDLDIIALNDDVNVADSSARISVTLPDDGTYMIVATRAGLADGTTAGVFTVELAAETVIAAGAVAPPAAEPTIAAQPATPPPEPTPSVAEPELPDDLPPAITPDPNLPDLAGNNADFCFGKFLTYGEAATGFIDDIEYIVPFCFDGRAGDRVVIRQEALQGNLDSLVAIVYPGETENDSFFLASNDDANRDTRDAALVYILPADATYLILASRFDFEFGRTEGRFRLTLDVVE